MVSQRAFLCLPIFVANKPIMKRCTSKYIGVIKSQNRGLGAKSEASHDSVGRSKKFWSPYTASP